jgi:membrane-associated phospholipid phosphatase
VKLYLLTLFVCLWLVPSSAGQSQKGTAGASAPRTCTDLSGEPVPCPGQNQTVLPSAKNGSADVRRRCVDLLGQEVSCPGEHLTPSAGAAVSDSKSRLANGTSAKAPAVVPAGSTRSIAPVAVSGYVCRDLLGQPVSCPVDATDTVNANDAAAIETSSASVAAKGSSASAPSNAIYVEPVRKPETSLERSLPRHVYLAQKEFWTSPARMRLNDAYWAVPFGITTGGLIAADVSIKNALPQSPSTIKNFKDISNYGAIAYGGLVGASYLFGKAAHNSYMSDTAWLAGEAGLNSFITAYGMKYAFGRQRPTEGNGQGDFFSGGQSFPSEHSAAVWSVATVFAGRYPGTMTKLAMFGGAALISASRVIGQQHFSSDAFLGSALGYYFGRQALKRYQLEHLTDSMYGTFVRETPSLNRNPANMSSPYVPLDSWVYPLFDRLAAMGYIQTAFTGQRPWTRLECARLLDEASARFEVNGDGSAGAVGMYRTLKLEFSAELSRRAGQLNREIKLQSLYSRVAGISGPVLIDGYHFGQTTVGDYGRPSREGVNFMSGFSAYGSADGLSGYVSGEYQYAPSAPALPLSARQVINVVDQGAGVPPDVPYAPVNRFRLIEGYASFTLGGWQLTAGKQSLWWGPSGGTPLLFSNNAEGIPMVRFDRVSPLKLPSVLGYIGPMKIETILGQLQGQQIIYGVNTGLEGAYGDPYSPQPYITASKITFKTTPNLEVGFGFSTLFAGKGLPLTMGTWWRAAYFGHGNGNGIPGSPQDSGDGRSQFDISYRIPKLRNWLTFYADGLSEDQPQPIFYPDRAAWRAGLYAPRLPYLPKLDLRVEGLYTDLPIGGAVSNGYFYYNGRFRSGFTEEGNNIIGSWIGRQGQGAQAWSTYWLTPRNSIQASFRHLKVSKDYIPAGGTMTDGAVSSTYWFGQNLNIAGTVQYERWNFPVIEPMAKSNLGISLKVTFYPERLKK